MTTNALESIHWDIQCKIDLREFDTKTLREHKKQKSRFKNFILQHIQSTEQNHMPEYTGILQWNNWL